MLLVFVLSVVVGSMVKGVDWWMSWSIEVQTG